MLYKLPRFFRLLRFESTQPNFEKSFHPRMVSPLLSRQFVSLHSPALIKKETREERERKSPTTPVRKLVVRDNLLVPIIIIELLAAAEEDDPS